MNTITHPDGHVSRYESDLLLAMWDPFQRATSAWNNLDWVAHATWMYERSMEYLRMCADPREPMPFTDYESHEDAMLNVDDAFDAMQV